MEVPANGDYYLDLGLIENATAEQIRKAFRKLSLATHPDKHPGKEEEFQPKFVKARRLSRGTIRTHLPPPHLSLT